MGKSMERGWIRLTTPQQALDGIPGEILPYSPEAILRWFDGQTLHPMYRMALAEMGRPTDWFASG
jgi:hypothetical protein